MSAPKLIKLEDNMSDKQTTENAVDYKATLNLPDTQFAMKANLAVRSEMVRRVVYRQHLSADSCIAYW
jgi:hypothetical protein